MSRTVSALALSVFLSVVSAPAFAQPNILVLMAEDLSPRIGAYGDSYAQTPNIDELAERATLYTHAFTTAGVCAPSRAAFITGQHQISFGGQHMRSSTGPLGLYYAQPAPEVRAFPEILRAHGYFTFTDTKLDYQFSGIRAHSGPFTIWDLENASDTAWRERAPNQPFFGLINFIETHESGVMRQTGEMYSASHAASVGMRKPITALREKVSDPELAPLPPYFPDTPETRADVARHYDNIHLMDKRVGRILRALEEDGLLAKTIVIWTSDHGDGLPRSKREVLDSGTRVPLLISKPGEPPTRSDQLISFVDFAPTFLRWAGITPPAWLHGQSIDEAHRRYVFSSRDRIDEVRDRQRSARSARYRYIRSWFPNVPGGHALNYRDNIDMVQAWRARFAEGVLSTAQAKWFEPVGTEQLYDLTEDPYELTNLAQSKAHIKVINEHRSALDSFLTRVGDTSDQPEEIMRDAFLENGAVRQTPAPTASLDDKGNLHLRSAIGASIGYRITEGRWKLYTNPIPKADLVKEIDTKAVRYGWRESEIVKYSNDLSSR